MAKIIPIKRKADSPTKIKEKNKKPEFARRNSAKKL